MNKLLPLAALLAGHAVVAQQAPSAGQLVPPPPAPPALQRAPPDIRIEQRQAAPPAAGISEQRIVVSTLRISGATQFAELDLVAVAGFRGGAEYSLPDLQAMALRITRHYRSSGYFVAQAFLPAQDVKDGIVTIAVTEGHYGQVSLRNSSNLHDRVAREALAGVASGDVIVREPLENRLLLLSDLPGVTVRSTLVPGTAPGTSDLIVEIEPGRRVTGSVDFDNAGNRYTGAYRLGATVNVNDPAGLGDVATLRLLTSGSGLQYARIAYQLPVGRVTAGAAYSTLHYSLGREFAPLNAHGNADIASVFARYAVVRSRTDNLYLQLEFDARRFRDRVDSIPAQTDRSSRVLMASLFGDHRDDVGGGSLNTYGATFSTGRLDIETPGARALDAVTAHTQGHYNKLTFSLMRLQSLGGPYSVYAALSGQLASKNLDVSEKMELGGMNAVRAYPEGEAYADEGALLTLEGRMDLPKSERVPGLMQLIVFADVGAVTIDHNPWAPGLRHRTLGGAGVGLNWAMPGNFNARAYYAVKLGSGSSLSAPDKSGRFWLQLVKYF